MKQTEIARLRTLAALAKKDSDIMWTGAVTDWCQEGPRIVDELEKLSKKRKSHVLSATSEGAKLVESLGDSDANTRA